jgi:hypothetical protein
MLARMKGERERKKLKFKLEIKGGAFLIPLFGNLTVTPPLLAQFAICMNRWTGYLSISLIG